MVLTAVIEMEAGTNYKYEIDKATGELVLDRVLNLFVPVNYGYVPNTMCDDGDALDIFVYSKYLLVPKSRVNVEILGVYKCVDNGQRDDKLVGMLVGERDKIDGGPVFLIEHYLENYKAGFQVLEFCDATEALEIYRSSLLGMDTVNA